MAHFNLPYGVNTRIVRARGDSLTFSWEAANTDTVSFWAVTLREVRFTAAGVAYIPSEYVGPVNYPYQHRIVPGPKNAQGKHTGIVTFDNLDRTKVYQAVYWFCTPALLASPSQFDPSIRPVFFPLDYSDEDDDYYGWTYSPRMTTSGFLPAEPAKNLRVLEPAGGRVTLAWADTNYGERRYQVERRMFDSGAWGEWTVRAVLLQRSSSYVDTSTTGLRRYEYRIVTLPMGDDTFSPVSAVLHVATAPNETIEHVPGLPGPLITPTTTRPYTLDGQQRFPFSLLVMEGGHEYEFMTAGAHDSWQAQVASQKASRFQTGSRTIHDMSMLNAHAWTDLHRGGVGAKQTSDGTRYREAHNIVVSDAGEMKLAPGYVDMNLDATATDILFVIPWAGFNASATTIGANSLAVMVLGFDGTNTKITRLPVDGGGKLTGDAVPAAPSLTMTGKVTGWTIFRNRLWLARTSGIMQSVRWDTATSAFVLENAPGPNTNAQTAHVVYSDGDWFYRAVANEVYRSQDPTLATPVWQGPVRVGSAAPVTGMTTFGSEGATALFCTTWHGCYRILEEAVPNDTSNAKTIKSSFPVDVRPGMADDDNGKLMLTINNEVVWNYPGALARHTLGQTTLSSPWDDNGVPAEDRGRFTAMQDGRGGIMVACVPYTDRGRTMLYRLVDGRWHHFADVNDLSTSSREVRTLAWTHRGYADTARLWVGGNGLLRYYKLPTSTTNYALLPSQTYVPEGSIEFPVFTGDLDTVDKLWHDLYVQMDPEYTSVYDAVVSYTTDLASSPASFVRAGTYSPVPRKPGFPAQRTWVACSNVRSLERGEDAQSNGVLMGQELSEALRVRLTLQQQVQAHAAHRDIGRYPVPPLQDVRLCVTHEHLICYGLGSFINQQDGNNAGLYANYDAAVWSGDHWELLKLRAFTLTGVSWDATMRVFLFTGAFAPFRAANNPDILVDAPTLLQWDPETNAVSAVADVGTVVTAAVASGNSVYLAAVEGARTDIYRVQRTTHEATALPLPVLIANWNNCRVSAMVLQSGVGIWMKSSGTAMNEGGTPIGLALLNLSNVLVRPAPIAGSATREQLLSSPLMAVDPNGHLYFGGNTGTASTEVYRWTGGTAALERIELSPIPGRITALATSARYLEWANVNGGLGRIVLLGQTGQAAEFSRYLPPGQKVTSIVTLGNAVLFAADPADDLGLGAVSYSYPDEPQTIATRPSPRVRAVGVRYLEMADELRTYVLTLKLADQGESQDHRSERRSADQQLHDILRLVRKKVICAMVMPDGTRMQAILSGPRWQQVSGSPLRWDRPEMDNVEYRITVTCQEVTYRPRSV